jgi:hypothetical protein
VGRAKKAKAKAKAKGEHEPAKLNPNVASESHATTRNGVAEASSWYLCADRRTNEMTA